MLQEYFFNPVIIFLCHSDFSLTKQAALHLHTESIKQQYTALLSNISGSLCILNIAIMGNPLTQNTNAHKLPDTKPKCQNVAPHAPF